LNKFFFSKKTIFVGRKTNNLMESSIFIFRLGDWSVQNLFNYSMDIASFCNSILWWSGTFSLGGNMGVHAREPTMNRMQVSYLRARDFAFIWKVTVVWPLQQFWQASLIRWVPRVPQFASHTHTTKISSLKFHSSSTLCALF
jgi:hypothetical protein